MNLCSPQKQHAGTAESKKTMMFIVSADSNEKLERISETLYRAGIRYGFSRYNGVAQYRVAEKQSLRVLQIMKQEGIVSYGVCGAR